MLLFYFFTFFIVGATSSLGSLYELGPYHLKSNTTLGRRNTTWNIHYHLLFVDQPIGTGLSYKDPTVDYLHNETQVAFDMDFFLRDFFRQYQEFQKNKFYTFGESYGGHYIPSISVQIVNGNAAGLTPYILLTGCAIGNGFNSPCEQIPHTPDLSLQMGLMNRQEYEDAKVLVDELRLQCRHNHNFVSYAAVGAVLGSVLLSSGGVNNENFRTFLPYDYTKMVHFYNNITIQERLHVNPRVKHFVEKNMAVFTALTFDEMASMSPKYAFLLEHGLDVLIYHGNDDPMFVTAGEEAWLYNVDWHGQAAFQKTPRLLWKTRSTQSKAGYVTIQQNLHYAIVLNAGHLVPQDQPENAWDLVQRFIEKDWEM